MNLLEEARSFTQAAENARVEGDIVASIALAIHAAQLLQLHRLLGKE